MTKKPAKTDDIGAKLAALALKIADAANADAVQYASFHRWRTAH